MFEIERKLQVICHHVLALMEVIIMAVSCTDFAANAASLSSKTTVMAFMLLD